jgi:hypothetical protein
MRLFNLRKSADNVTDYKIYVLRDPRNNKVRFVGATDKDLSMRLATHIWRAPIAKYSRCNRWIRKLLRNGFKPVIECVDHAEDNDVDHKRLYWIYYYKGLYKHLLNKEAV